MELIPQANARGDMARALVLAEVFGTPYSETPLYALERALGGGGEEYRIAEVEGVDEAGAAVALRAVALFGSVAGTVGTARVFLVAPTTGDARVSATEALTAAVGVLESDGIRLVIAELPDDRCFDGMRQLLLEFGFREECRVDDLIRDGVALTFLRYELGTR